MENKESIKVSKSSKEFLKKMKVNRIKLDLEELDYSGCIERIANYFKNNDHEYIRMIKEEDIKNE